MRVKILIADPSPILCERLRLLLGRAVHFAGEATRGSEAVRLAAERGPDVALVAMDMPDIDGIEMTRRIKALSPRTRVILMTSHHEHTLLAAATGADALVSKRRLSAELVRKVREVGAAAGYWSPRERRGHGAAGGLGEWDGIERRRDWPPEAS